MVELVSTELTERKVLQRKQAENEVRIAENEAKIVANEAEIARNCEEIKRLEEKSLKLSHQLTIYLTLSAIVPPLLCLAIVSSFIFICPDLFVDVSTDYGFDAYAETPIWLISLQPKWLRMPGNLLVNIGYLIVGVYWLNRLYLNIQPFMTRRNVSCIYLKACFCWASIYYGFVQAARISFQNHQLSVVDQWVTLPIFALSALLCYTVKNGPLSPIMETACVATSLATYFAATVFLYGFELALVAHIAVAVWCGLDVWRSVKDHAACRRIFWRAILCCTGFVVLKVLDFHLLELSILFRYLSGHFWSKICDIMQIHYTLLFVEATEKMF